METIDDLIKLAKSGKLDGAAVLGNLVDSEGKQGSVHVKAVGHPLQHVARLSGGSGFQSLKSDYHFRGPMKYTSTGPKVQGIKSHSQFQDENEAAEAVAAALSSPAGLKAMATLKDPKYTVSLEFTLAAGLHLERSAHVLEDPKGPNANCNFVMFDAVKTVGIQLELHHSRKISNGLHVQSAYPLTSGPKGASAVLEITEWPAKTTTSENFT